MNNRYFLSTLILLFTLTISSSVTLHAQFFESRLDIDTGDKPISVAIGDLNGDSNQDIVTANNDSNDVSVLLGNGDSTFQTEISYSAGTNPSSIVIGDFNGDGNLDLATANSGSNDVSVLLGNGDGTFLTKVDYSAGIGSCFVTMGDLDGDEVFDLVLVNIDSDEVSVLINNGDGTYQDALHYGVGNGPCSVAVGLLNEDAFADLAVANSLSNDISILLGAGDGTFQDATTYYGGKFPQSIIIDDFNSDGFNDLAVAMKGNDNNDHFGYCTVLPGNGDGSFPHRYYNPVGQGTSSIASGDFNGDSNLDIAVVNNGSNEISVLLGNGNSSFHTPVNYGLGRSPQSLAVGDMDGDGNTDLAVTNTSSNTLSALLGRGDGTFQAAVNYSVGDRPNTLAAGDVDGDGIVDLVVSNGGDDNISVLLGNGDGSFQSSITQELGNYPFLACESPYAVALQNLDGDDNLDLIVQGYENLLGDIHTLITLLGNGDGTFQFRYRHFIDESGTLPMEFGDLNSDGNLDVVLFDCGTGIIQVLLGNGNGTFSPESFYFEFGDPLILAIGDLDGDNNHDLVITIKPEFVLGGIEIFPGNGDGTFQASWLLEEDHPKDIVLDDLDSDGDLDLAFTNTPGHIISVRLNYGDGSFQPAMHYWTEYNSRTVRTGDMNGDSHPDLVMWNSSRNGCFTLMLGNGDGTFQTGEIIFAGCRGCSDAILCNLNYIGLTPHFTICDLDNDDDSDLVKVNSSGDNISVLLNNLISNTPMASDALATQINCEPEFGTLPFNFQLTASFHNLNENHARRIAGQLDATLADGKHVPFWRSGFTNIAPLQSHVAIWNQHLPALDSLLGSNIFTLLAEDVTPSPYNQPPYPPSGYTITDSCIVVGN